MLTAAVKHWSIHLAETSQTQASSHSHKARWRASNLPWKPRWEAEQRHRQTQTLSCLSRSVVSTLPSAAIPEASVLRHKQRDLLIVSRSAVSNGADMCAVHSSTGSYRLPLNTQWEAHWDSPPQPELVWLRCSVLWRPGTHRQREQPHVKYRWCFTAGLCSIARRAPHQSLHERRTMFLEGH